MLKLGGVRFDVLISVAAMGMIACTRIETSTVVKSAPNVNTPQVPETPGGDQPGIATETLTPTPISSGVPTPVSQAPFCDTYYQANACAYKFNDGVDLQVEANSQITEIFFGKKLDLAKLSPTYKGSPKSIYEFAKAQGLEIFTTGRDCGCNMFDEIPKAQGKPFEYWNNIGADSLLGLFLPIVQVINITSDPTIKNPILMLRADTDKWTLVHEYTHYLFDLQRIQNEGISTDQLKQKVKTALSHFVEVAKIALETGGDSVLKDQLAPYTKAYIDFANSNLDLKSAYTLEEVTIESYLSSQYEAGLFTQTTRYSRYGAAGYIDSKYREFNSEIEIYRDGVALDNKTGERQKLFAGVVDLQKQIEATLVSSPGDESLLALKDQLLILQNRITKLVLELNSLEEKYVAPLKSFSGKMIGKTPFPMKSCAHEQIQDFSIREVKNRLSQITKARLQKNQKIKLLPDVNAF